MRAAAALLGAASDGEGILALLRAARLASGPCVPLDPPSADALGVPRHSSGMAAGVGAIRVLVLELEGQEPLRSAIERIVARLSSRAPHVLWVLAVRDAASARSAIVGWHAEGRGRRIVAFVWEPRRPVDSDAETLCALHSAYGDADELVHARILEILGRDSLTRRFYRALESRVTGLARCTPLRNEEQARALALLYVSRLLFLSFLEAKGWLDGNRAFLGDRFDLCMQRGGEFHRRVLLPLFFGTLNTPLSRRAQAARGFGRVPFLNGGLFTRTALERRAGRWTFPDEELGALFTDVFQRFRFVAREDSATWSEASVDPEMLGRAFESLMSGAERKAGGIFFTPHELVGRVTAQAMDAWTTRGAGELRTLTVLDPACGSGAFLVHMLETLAAMRMARGEAGTVAEIRRDVLARSIFGVDRNPTAVWLCELRLWLSVVIELQEDDPSRVPPLPNLDRNVRVGDALAGAGFEACAVGESRAMAALRGRYIRAVGMKKASLARALDREERRRTIARLEREIASLRHERREQVEGMRSRNLFGERTGIADKALTRRLRARLRAARAESQRLALGGALPFSFAAMFAEAQAQGGFDVIVGNPPWVRLHRIPEALRSRFRESFEVFRSAAWREGAARARAGQGFASQVDLAALFVERSLRLLRTNGVLSLLVPVKLWQSLSGGGVRRLLLEQARVLRVEDLGADVPAFDAAVYPSLMVAAASEPVPTGNVALARAERGGSRAWNVVARDLPLDGSPGAPWLLLPADARAGFALLRSMGTPLADSHLGAPRLGVKSGCNAAFLLRVVATTPTLAIVESADGERAKVEAALLRPALRGDAVTRWRREAAREWILWTHDEAGPLPALPTHARAWLDRHRGALSSRSDAARARRWWSLFRVDAAANETSRLVWADFGRRPRALVLPPGDPTVPLNTCYVLPAADEADAWALAAVLNSDVGAAWLNAIAEHARGGYRRYLGWTVGYLPLPARFARSRDDLATMALRAAEGSVPDDALTDAVLRAYGTERSAVAALLATCAR